MPIHGKKCMKEIVNAYTQGITKFGNPYVYVFELECGHNIIRMHNPHWSVLLFAWSIMKLKGVKELPKIHCPECARQT